MRPRTIHRGWRDHRERARRLARALEPVARSTSLERVRQVASSRASTRPTEQIVHRVPPDGPSPHERATIASASISAAGRVRRGLTAPKRPRTENRPWSTTSPVAFRRRRRPRPTSVHHRESIALWLLTSACGRRRVRSDQLHVHGIGDGLDSIGIVVQARATASSACAPRSGSAPTASVRDAACTARPTLDSGVLRSARRLAGEPINHRRRFQNRPSDGRSITGRVRHTTGAPPANLRRVIPPSTRTIAVIEHGAIPFGARTALADRGRRPPLGVRRTEARRSRSIVPAQAPGLSARHHQEIARPRSPPRTHGYSTRRVRRPRSSPRSPGSCATG